MRKVQACLNTEKVRESCFNPRANAVMCHERFRKQLSPLLNSCEARASLFKSEERPRQQFLPLWSPCEARASLFISGNDLTKPF